MYRSGLWPCVKKVFKIVVVRMRSLLVFVNSGGFRAASCLHEVQSYGNHVDCVISYRDFC